jgi:hypothetical protein
VASYATAKSVDEQVDSLVSSVEGLSDNTKSLIDNVAGEIDAKVKAIRAVGAAAAAAMSALKKELKEKHAKNMQTLNDQHQQNLDSLNKKRASFREKVDKLFKEKVEVVTNKLGSLQEDMTALGSDFKEAQEGLKTIPEPAKLSNLVASLSTTHYLDHSVPYCRWNMWQTHQHRSSWYVGNNNEQYGGIHPSQWTDGNAVAWSMQNDFKYLRSLFKQSAKGGKWGMNLCSETYMMFSSTTGLMCGAVFRIHNSNGGTTRWRPQWAWTSYRGWSERASISVNGQGNWHSNHDIHGIPRDTHNLDLPGKRTSTVVFIVGSNRAYHTNNNQHERATVLQFYQNTLRLPSGLEYRDDLDTVQGRWKQ